MQAITPHHCTVDTGTGTYISTVRPFELIFSQKSANGGYNAGTSVQIRVSSSSAKCCGASQDKTPATGRA